jgi:hypothetical protein
VRKLLLPLVVVAALVSAGAAGATVAPPVNPHVLCGSCGGNGGGYTGCSQVSASHSANVGVASIRHYLVVNYCKVAGIITSVSIAAHGCDVNGLIHCDTGPAWQTGGGVGSSSATFEGHASWSTAPYLWSNTDVVTLTVPAG